MVSSSSPWPSAPPVFIPFLSPGKTPWSNSSTNSCCQVPKMSLILFFPLCWPWKGFNPDPSKCPLPSFMGSAKNFWRKSQLTNYLLISNFHWALNLSQCYLPPSSPLPSSLTDDLASSFTSENRSQHAIIHSLNKCLSSHFMSKGCFWVLAI